MFIRNLKISRWILAPELALCFVPLTMVWVESLFGMSGLIHLNSDIIQWYFSSTTGTIMLVTMIAAVILGLLGPLGLILALRLIVSSRSLPARLPFVVLIAGPVLLGTIYLTSWLLMGTELGIDYWRGLILISLLPALGATHMLYLNPVIPGRQ